MDFVHDALAAARPFRVLTVVDQWSRQSPILEAAWSTPRQTVGTVLDQAIAHGIAPRSITVDPGTGAIICTLDYGTSAPAPAQLLAVTPGKVAVA